MSRTGVTLRDVADAAGVSIATASYALRGHATVTKATRSKVEAAARELGYHKDAAASLLAAKQRHSRVKRVGKISLGLFHNPDPTLQIEKAFREIAGGFGYGCEMLEREAVSSPAFFRHLRYRNVAGLFFNWMDDFMLPPNLIDPSKWTRFALAKFSRGLPHFLVPIIRHSAFDYMHITTTTVRERGYRRLALIFVPEPKASVRNNNARMGAVLGHHLVREHDDVVVEWREIPAHEIAQFPSDSIRRWLENFHPDVIIGFPSLVYQKLCDAGYRFPSDCAFVGIPVPGDYPDLSGPLIRNDEIARLAVQSLHRSLQFDERGFQLHPDEYVIEPFWNEGKTLPMRGGHSVSKA